MSTVDPRRPFHNAGAQRLAEFPTREVARRCKVSPSTASRWLSGATPGPEHQRRIAHEFGISPKDWGLRPRDLGAEPSAPTASSPTLDQLHDLLDQVEALPITGTVAELGAGALADLQSLADDLEQNGDDVTELRAALAAVRLPASGPAATGVWLGSVVHFALILATAPDAAGRLAKALVDLEVL